MPDGKNQAQAETVAVDFLGKTSTAIHASATMWEFFTAPTLPIQP